MNAGTPQSLWDRLMRKLDGEDSDDREVVKSTISFHLLFIVPLFLVLILLVRR